MHAAVLRFEGTGVWRFSQEFWDSLDFGVLDLNGSFGLLHHSTENHFGHALYVVTYVGHALYVVTYR